MASSPRGFPRDVRHPPFLQLIFCQRRGNFPPGAPDQGCKSRNIAIASLYRKQTEKPAASTHRRCPFRCDDLTSTMSSSTFSQAVSSHRRHPESSRFSGGARDLTRISRSSQESNVHQPHYFIAGKSKDATVHPHFSPLNHTPLLGQGHNPIMQLTDSLRPDRLSQTHQRLGVRHLLPTDPAEAAIHHVRPYFPF